MQSQQKKIKWSRGETADALEERTDTGITQVSVSRMENIIADIYGNISRRPALKIISSDMLAREIPTINIGALNSAYFDHAPDTFVFTINANSYIIFVKDYNGTFGGLLIENNKFVKRVKITDNTGWPNTPEVTDMPVSAAQYNNFMVVSNLFWRDVILRLTDTNDIVIERFEFSAPWYAPEGTKTMEVNSSQIAGLQFDASSIGAYTYTEENGITTVYSWISTGISSGALTATWTADTTSFYLHYDSQAQKYYVNTDSTGAASGPFTFTQNQTYSDGQNLGHAIQIVGVWWDMRVMIRNGTAGLGIEGLSSLIDISYGFTFQIPYIADIIPIGSIVQFPNNGAYMRVEGFDSDGSKLRMYGSFLTPVANDTATDTRVKVEYGYVSLNEYIPKKFTFSNQRLYASGFWNINMPQTLIPGYAVGSQVGRYNDFKNDYNMDNEAVVIDISTHYQEKIVSLIDYNGLKILTDSAEYSYTNGGIVKQSENGSLENCTPIVCGSVCIYADKSGNQLRAMQYEFQSDLFTSSSINQMAKEDLIFSTTSLASYIDKEHFTGRFLYAIQFKYTGTYRNHPEHAHSMAVCNFTPGNQAMIWTRWTTPTFNPSTAGTAEDYLRNSVVATVEVNNKVWFIIACSVIDKDNPLLFPQAAYTLAELDFDARLDFDTPATTNTTTFEMIPALAEHSMYGWRAYPNIIVYSHTKNVNLGDPLYDRNDNQVSTAENSSTGTGLTFRYNGVTVTGTRDDSLYIKAEFATLQRTTVSVFDGEEYKWDDTTNTHGDLTQSLVDLTDPHIGFKIDAVLESHPLDVGGKTYTDKKRIGKAVAVIRDTEPGAFTVCQKTGYTSPDKKTVSFYGCTGMKDQVRYTITNIQGAKFTIESLTMIIEYGTLES